MVVTATIVQVDPSKVKPFTRKLALADLVAHNFLPFSAFQLRKHKAESTVASCCIRGNDETKMLEI